MTSRPDHTLLRGVHVLFLLLVTVAGCTVTSNAQDWRLTPLTVRPGEADSASIEDQNDLMPSASPNGESVLFTSHRSGTFRLYVMNADGSNEHVISRGPGTQMQGSWSPDGGKIVYIHREDDNTSLAVMNADGSDPEILTEATGDWPTAFWSPDGERILYHAAGGIGADDIWIIDPEGGEPEVVLGSASAEWHPAWSPDGSQVVFASRRDGDDFEIYVADLNGGPWTQLTDNEVDDYSPTWSPDGTRIVFQAQRGGRWTILTVNADGSAQTPITHYPMHWDPVWSHDGSEIFFNSARDGRRGIYVMNADGTNQRKLTNTETSTFVRVVREAGVDEAARLFRDARAENPEAVYFYEREVQYLGENYLEMGHLRQAALLFEVNVEAYPESKAAHTDLGKTRLAAGDIGLALESYQRALELDPEDGQISELLERLREQMGAAVLATGAGAQDESTRIYFMNPDWSPDGTRIVFESGPEQQQSIYTIGLDGESLTRLTDDQNNDEGPVWSRDGKQIAFFSNRRERRDELPFSLQICIMNADGTGQRRISDDAPPLDWSISWSPDGSQIVFQSRPETNPGVHSLYVVGTDGMGRRRITDGQYDDTSPQWSPVGNLILFTQAAASYKFFRNVTREERQFATASAEIRVLNLDDGTIEAITQNDLRDVDPSWNADGSEIHYLQDNGLTKTFLRQHLGQTDAVVVADGDVVANSGSVTRTRLSPNGRLLTYHKEVDGMYGIYIYDLELKQERRLVGASAE